MSEEKPVTTLARLNQMFDEPIRLQKTTELAPKNFDVRRMFTAVVAMVARTRYLQDCSADSIARCAVQAAELGISPTGVLGGAYLVPFKDTCTLIIGYRGLIDLARRSGQVSTIEARVVRDKDDFDYEYGLMPRLSHVPHGPGDPVQFYAVATLADGAKQFEVMTKAQVDAIRARVREGKTSPWQTDYEEMARKTVVRRLCKYLPLTAEAAQGLEAVEDEEFENAREVEASEREDKPSSVDKLKEKLGINKPEAPAEEGWTEPPDLDAPKEEA